MNLTLHNILFIVVIYQSTSANVHIKMESFFFENPILVFFYYGADGKAIMAKIITKRATVSIIPTTMI